LYYQVLGEDKKNEEKEGNEEFNNFKKQKEKLSLIYVTVR